jgi:hypothetical protein
MGFPSKLRLSCWSEVNSRGKSERKRFLSF